MAAFIGLFIVHPGASGAPVQALTYSGFVGDVAGGEAAVADLAPRKVRIETPFARLTRL